MYGMRVGRQPLTPTFCDNADNNNKEKIIEEKAILINEPVIIKDRPFAPTALRTQDGLWSAPVSSNKYYFIIYPSV